MKQNKHQLEHLPILLVQQLRLQWYKDCRGGNAAAQRNQYPRAMRLPKDFFSYYSFGLPTHFVSILQRPNGFQIDKDCRRLIEWKPNGSMRIHPFELIQKESGLHVRYRNDWHIGAMPERYTYDETGQNSPSMSWHWIWLPVSMGELSAMGDSGTGIQESGIMYWIF